MRTSPAEFRRTMVTVAAPRRFATGMRFRKCATVGDPTCRDPQSELNPFPASLLECPGSTGMVGVLFYEQFLCPRHECVMPGGLRRRSSREVGSGWCIISCDDAVQHFVIATAFDPFHQAHCWVVFITTKRRRAVTTLCFVVSLRLVDVFDRLRSASTNRL